MGKICVIGLGGYSVFLSVDHFNQPGETVKAKKMFIEAGGKGYNQAVACSRLGAETTFIGAFGNDAEGKFCIDFLGDEGINAVPVYKKTPTAYACIITDSDGENRVTVYGGAASLLDTFDIEPLENEIKDTNVLVLQNEVPIETNLCVMRIAKKYGVFVIFNPAPAVGVNRELLNLADVITPNEQEAIDLFGRDYLQAIAENGYGKVVVTLGSKGCVVVDGEGSTFIDAIPTVAIDTTGAGDCFNGALAVAIAEGKSLKEAARFASAAASIAGSKHGAVGAMPHKNEILI